VSANDAIGPREFFTRLVKGLFQGKPENTAMPSVEFWLRREAQKGRTE
jgi:hypothetical protein